MLCTGKRRTKRLFFFLYHLALDGEQIERKKKPTNRLNMREHMQQRAYNWISMFALEMNEEREEKIAWLGLTVATKYTKCVAHLRKKQQQ